MLVYTKTFPGWKMIFDVFLLWFHLLSFSLRREFIICSDRQPQASKLYQRSVSFHKGQMSLLNIKDFQR